MSQPKANISAIVVAHNEAALLPRCLKSLDFCAEIIVIDLKSKDNSAQVAKQLGAKVITHPWVPIGEMAREAGLRKAKSDWLLIIDPDEEITPTLASDITKATKNSDTAGIISVPWFNYFKSKPLKGTVWGGYNRRKRILMHKKRAYLVSKVHADFFTIRDGYTIEHIAVNKEQDNWLNHSWIRSWSEFQEKHTRYLRLEGEARYTRGDRFRYRQLIKVIPYRFWESYIIAKGYRDGLLGLGLSLLWVWYNFMSLLSLRNYQKDHRG